MSGRPGDIFLTSDKPRVNIPNCAPHVHNHAVVLYADADLAVRRHALKQIERLADEGNDNGARAVLDHFKSLHIDLDEKIVPPGKHKQDTPPNAANWKPDKIFKVGQSQRTRPR
jgi:hypothetical protein